MKIPNLKDFDLKGKRVLLRVDYDVPLEKKDDGRRKVGDDSRIVESFPTINYLLSLQAKVILLSHLGRPEGKRVPDFDLAPIAETLAQLLHRSFKPDNGGWRLEEDLFLLDNLRFDPGEEADNPEFTKKIASWGEFYINDAFAVSHRAHASIVGLPKLLPHAAGFDLLEEAETLSKLLEEPKRPIVVILGGTKKDKLDSLPGLLSWADSVLIGGKLVEHFDKKGIVDNKIKLAKLTPDGLDVAPESIAEFISIVNSAGSIVWAGPMGKFEDESNAQGTLSLAKAVSDSPAYTVLGGGETEEFLERYGLLYGVQYISSGGGAMLEFLADGDLPGLKALREPVATNE